MTFNRDNFKLYIDGVESSDSLKGEDAEPVARYEIVPSDNSIMRDFKGALSPARLTARVFRDTGIAMAEVTLGGSNSLRYSIDGGTEQTYSPASGIATGGAKQKITLTFYVGVIRWASLDVPVHGIRAQLDGSGNLTIGEAVVNVRGPKPVLSLNAQHQLVADGVLVSDTVLKGTDGITPEIDPTTKRWKIGGTLTQVKAEGTDGQPGTPGTPGKDFKYTDFTAAQLDALQSGVKSKIDTSAFRSDIGVRIKTDVKDLLKGDSGFVALTKGEPGSKGDKGDKGDQGIQGLKGTDGISPHIGNDGYWYSGSTKLSVKAQGPTGPQGLQGPKGDQGLKGNDGAKGDKGDKGDKGLKGDTPVLSLNSSYQLLADGALVSSASLRGPQGIQGLKGDTGLQGPSGPQGPAGPTGPTGPQGKTFRPSFSGETLTFTASTDTSNVSLSGIARTSQIPTKDTVANWGFATTSALNSGLAGKASLADVQGAGFVKYANGKLTYCSGLTCSDLNISSASHNHDSVYAKISHTHSQYAAASHIHAVVEGTYSGKGGAKNPNAYGINRVGFFMSSQVVNGNSQYKDWILLDCYGGNDVGGAVAIGVNRQSLGAYIMRSAAARTAWAASAELIGTHNYASILDGRYYTEAEVNSLVGGKVSKSGDTMSGALGVLGMRFEHTNEINANGIERLCIGYRNTPGGVNLCHQNAPLTYGSAASTIWHAGNDGHGSGLDADTVDGLHLSDIRSYGYAMQDTWIDASSLNADTWYPVTIPLSTSSNTRIEVLVALDSGKKPAWSTHKAGFTVRLIWECQGNGWGTNNGVTRRVIESSCLYVSGNVMPVRGVGQLINGSIEYVYVRGGGRYRFRTSHGAVPTLRTSTYTNNSQSVSPTTTVPAATNRNVAYVSDTVANANSLGGVAASSYLKKTDAYLSGVGAAASATAASAVYVTGIVASNGQVAARTRPISEITAGCVKTSGGQAISAAIRDVLTISGSASTGAAINLNNNGKQGVFGMNSNGLWFQNLYGANQPYIQLLNDGGFVLDKGTAGRFDILHDGNIYGFVPRVIYSACGKFQTSGYGFYPMEGALAATAVNVTFSIPKTNVIRITLGSAIYPVKRLRCTVETATWNSGLGLAMVGRTYGVCYLDSNGSGISNANTMVKYIDIYCVYNGALAAPVGYGCITIMLLPAIL